MAASVADLQNRMQELLYQFSGSEPQTENEQTLRNALKNMTKCVLDPKLDKTKLEEDLIGNLMNILIIAAELGFDIESKIENVIAELENNARGFSAA